MESARPATPAAAPQALAMTEPDRPLGQRAQRQCRDRRHRKGVEPEPRGREGGSRASNRHRPLQGPATGVLDDATRSALAEWQKKRGYAPTSFLNSIELAALRADSETEYQKFLAAEPAVPEKPRRAQVETSPRPLARRAAKPSEREAPARRTVRRTKPNRAETARQAAPRSPACIRWREPRMEARAGLPELPTDPGMGGRPPGFWTGAAGGLMLGGFRHHVLTGLASSPER